MELTVSLPAEQRATHMSRFLEVLYDFDEPLTLKSLPPILKSLIERLEAKKAEVLFRFPYFVKKEAPVSKSAGYNEYNCTFKGSVNDEIDLMLGVEVPVHSFCPCSKAISERGGHNQRGFIKMFVRFNKFIWIEDLIEIAETSASGAVHPVLKREDEKYVSEYAYDNPVFVEDMVRNVSEKLLNRNEISWFNIQVENIESIHNHEAFAETTINKNNS